MNERVMVLTQSSWQDEVIESLQRRQGVEAAASAERYVARHVGSLGREQLLHFVESGGAAPAESPERGA